MSAARGRYFSGRFFHAGVVASIVSALLAADYLWAAGTLNTSETGKSDSAKATPKAEAVAKPPAKGNVQTYGSPQVAYINELIRKGWTENDLVPSAPAPEGEWCRRVFLDIIGRVPSVSELEKFLSDRSPDRKAQLVNRLLSEDYVEEYARNWTTIWTNILVGRAAADNDGRTMVSREGMQQYLRRAFQKNKTYDNMVMELVSAKGSNKPGEENFNGAVNFLTGKLEENGVQATAKTAQVFLGMQVQCTQCHNHPFNEWKQNQFWELNAFFRQTRARRASGPRDMAATELANQDFRGEGSRDDEAEIYYELRNGILKAAYPVFVDGKTEISKSGSVSAVDRRTELAKLIVGSDYMAQAMVNRMWGHFMGYGFTKPVDDMGPHNPPTHPELLARLGEDFKTGSYNVKDLIRWIVLSEPYSLSSMASGGTRQLNKKDDPSLGEKPQFSRFYLRQMSAEQLYESLIVVTEAQKTQGSYEQQEKTKGDWLRQFTLAFGTDEGDESTTFNGTIPQVLMMFNGDLVKKATNGEKGSFLEQIAVNGKLNMKDKINYLFMASMARRANDKELGFVEKTLMPARKGDVLHTLQDAWWVLLNSNEFILNH